MRPSVFLPACLLLACVLAPPSTAQRSSISPGRFQKPLSADFKVLPLQGATQRSVQFCLDTPQPGSLALWDFGDGQTSKLKSPKHTYAVPGTYDVQLVLSNSIETTISTQQLTIAGVPNGFVDEFVFKTNLLTTGVQVLDEDDFITWSKEGTVWRWSNGAYCATPMVDISDEVANWGGHGLLRFLMDPDYATNGYVYLLYVVDRYHLDNFGQPGYDPAQSLPQTETIARLTRYTVFDPSDIDTQVDPSTRLVLLGNSIADGMPVCATSHSVGGLAFGEDGSLFLTLGDAWLGNGLQAECLSSGILTPRTDVKAFRSQLLDSPNGKLMRIDPATGQGHPSNPFFDAQAPDAWSSKVWALGLRNPYSFAVRPETSGVARLHEGPGVVYLADVGDNRWEELNVIETAGSNYGFPIYEGMDANSFWGNMNTQNMDAPNPLFGTSGCNEPFFRFEDLLIEDSQSPGSWPNRCDSGQEIPSSLPRFMHTRPAITWLHGDQPGAPQTLVPGFDPMGQAIGVDIEDPGTGINAKRFSGNAAIAGTWLTGGAFPAPFDDVMFNADYGEGFIKAFAFDAAHNLSAVHDFAFPEGRGIMFVTKDPLSRALYYLEYQTSGRGLYRIAYDANARPVPAVDATPHFGPGPLRVQLSAAGSSDPEGAPLSFDWDFGDGEPRSPLNSWAQPVHLFGAEDITDGLAVISNHGGGSPLGGAPSASSGMPQLGGRMTAQMPTIHDGSYGALGGGSPAEQQVIEARQPWVGYRIYPKRELAGLIFQEGLGSGAQGGSLVAPVVEYYDDQLGRWLPVSGLQVAGALPGDPGLGFESAHLSFDPVRTHFIRLRESASGSARTRFSVGELRVLATPEPRTTQPASFLASVSVTDPGGLEASQAVLVSIHNTPPQVTMTSPALGETYPVGPSVLFPMTATLSDAEHSSAELSCEWSVELVHDNHSHPEPVDNNCDTSLLLLPHNELQGDIIFWRFTLTVTDAVGLSTTVTRDLIPDGDCNLNGIDDATDIASGSSLDLDMNGVPDECE